MVGFVAFVLLVIFTCHLKSETESVSGATSPSRTWHELQTAICCLATAVVCCISGPFGSPAELAADLHSYEASQHMGMAYNCHSGD